MYRSDGRAFKQTRTVCFHRGKVDEGAFNRQGARKYEAEHQSVALHLYELFAEKKISIDLTTCTEKKLSDVLSFAYIEWRRQDGEPYRRASLLGFRGAVHRHLQAATTWNKFVAAKASRDLPSARDISNFFDQ